MVIMLFNEITVIALKNIIWCELKGYIDWNFYYHIYIFLSLYDSCKRCWQDQANDGKPATRAPLVWLAVLLLDSFRVPAHSPMPEYFIFTGSISHSVRFRLLADPGCCQGGDRWEWFFQLSPCWQPGPARQGMHRQYLFILQWHCTVSTNYFMMA